MWHVKDGWWEPPCGSSSGDGGGGGKENGDNDDNDGVARRRRGERGDVRGKQYNGKFIAKKSSTTLLWHACNEMHVHTGITLPLSVLSKGHSTFEHFEWFVG